MLEIETKLHLGSEEAAREVCRRLCLPWEDGIFERNRIFDFPDGRLRMKGALVRVRERGPGGFLTYKEKSHEHVPQAKVRLEFDTAVTLPDSAIRLLLGVGLVETLAYERYRARYPIGPVHLEIDCLPGGWFCEIEGSPGEIEQTRKAAGLEGLLPLVWSYPEIFAGLQRRTPELGRDWTFEAFGRLRLGLPPFGDPFWLLAAQES